MQKKSTMIEKKPEILEKRVAQRLQCNPEEVSFDLNCERIYIPTADLFHQMMRKHKINEIGNGGGYHFVFPMRHNKTLKYWKVTLASTENETFERKYASQYTIQNRKRLPGAFF